MSEGASSAARRRLPLWVVLGSLLLAGLGALLALNTASAAQELRQRSLTDSNSGLSDTQQQLIRDLAQEQAPSALASAAAALGLVPNTNPAFLKLQPDGSVSILGIPAPATAPAPPVKPTPSATATPTSTPTPTPAATPTPTATPAATPPVTAKQPPPTTAPPTAAAAATSPAAIKPAQLTPAALPPAAAAKSATATPTRTP